MICSINYPLRTSKTLRANWVYKQKMKLVISFLFRYLIKFEPEQTVTIGFLYWLLGYLLFFSLIFFMLILWTFTCYGLQGIDRLLVGPFGARTIFKIIGGGGEGEGGVCLTPTAPPPSSYASVTCTYMLWIQPWNGVYSLYIVLIAQTTAP